MPQRKDNKASDYSLRNQVLKNSRPFNLLFKRRDYNQATPIECLTPGELLTSRSGSSPASFLAHHKIMSGYGPVLFPVLPARGCDSDARCATGSVRSPSRGWKETRRSRLLLRLRPARRTTPPVDGVPVCRS